MLYVEDTQTAHFSWELRKHDTLFVLKVSSEKTTCAAYILFSVWWLSASFSPSLCKKRINARYSFLVRARGRPWSCWKDALAWCKARAVRRPGGVVENLTAAVSALSTQVMHICALIFKSPASITHRNATPVIVYTRNQRRISTALSSSTCTDLTAGGNGGRRVCLLSRYSCTDE